MLHLRHFSRLLVVLALLATAVAVAASPSTAQSGIVVLTFDNVDTDDWEVRVTANTLGGCTPKQGPASYSSGWLDTNDEGGEVFNPAVCTYVITAVAQNTTSNVDEICDAELQWGTGGGFSPKLNTSTRPADQATVQVRHVGGDTPSCSASIVLAFTIHPDEVVQALPPSGTDPDLQARAERAAAITEFNVRVTPDPSTVNRTGCNQSASLLVLGDGEEHEEGLEPVGSKVTCDWRAKIVGAPEPFVVVSSTGKKFSSADATAGEISVDLSDQVQLPYKRIAIIQDVANSGNEGNVSYTIARACAGVAALPPTAGSTGGSGIYTLPGGQTVATLAEGRFSVHTPNFANFGPGAVYPAVATSTTSSKLGGCSVTVSIEGLPSNCRVDGATTRTLTWSATNPFEHFDFEFDIDCSGAAAPATGTGLPPPAPGDSSTTSSGGDPGTSVPATSDDVRIVARKLTNGKIEFGLQQRDDDGWGARRLPRARLFPTDARVRSWLQSSPLTLSVAASADDFAQNFEVRIVARKLADGKVEFGLQQRDNGSWGDRQLPSARLFPTTAAADRWLVSSTLSLSS